MDALPAPTITDEQRAAALALIRADPARGHIGALRQAGVQGTKGQLRQLLTDELAEEIREARGWSIVKVEESTWAVAANPDHPSWDRANARILKAYQPAFRDIARHELTGKDGGPIALVAGQFDPDLLSEEELSGLRELLAKARQELPPGESP